MRSQQPPPRGLVLAGARGFDDARSVEAAVHARASYLHQLALHPPARPPFLGPETPRLGRPDWAAVVQLICSMARRCSRPGSLFLHQRRRAALCSTTELTAPAAFTHHSALDSASLALGFGGSATVASSARLRQPSQLPHTPGPQQQSCFDQPPSRSASTSPFAHASTTK